MKKLLIGVNVLTLLIAAGTLAIAGTGFEEKTAVQPHMRAALVQLESAKSQLQKASSDKGGHRTKALTLIQQAISEVKAGMAYDATHDRENRR